VKPAAELRYLKGVGPRRAERLAAEGVVTAEDLLYVLPFRYEDRRAYAAAADLQPGGAEVSLDLRVRSSRLIRTRRAGFTIFEALLEDASGSIRGVWYNQSYLERVLAPGRRAVFFGRPVADRRGRVQVVLENPEVEVLDEQDAEGIHTGRIVPVYRKLAGLSSRMLRGLIHRALESLEGDALGELVPRDVQHRLALMERLEALRTVHFPPKDADLGALADRRTRAHRSLAFEEIFVVQLALALRRLGFKEEPRGIAYRVPDALRTQLARMLPFELTRAQKRVLREIGADLRSPHPMCRLLQGDVGSGKTVVAMLTLLVAAENGWQGVLMAPTEILAEQHWRTFERLVGPEEAGARAVLLTGSKRAAARRLALARLAEGEAELAIGTHALFEEGVRFNRLGLVVVDEQHRFGVRQRAALVKKGIRPDLLVMTATPIPRSLALTFYGDLDLSLIDELPPGRTPIRTVVRAETERERVYAGMREAAARGQQIYVVVPLVEETEKSDLKAATAHAAHLARDVFPDLRVGLLHGRMKGEQKDTVMREFSAGRIQILVATTVVEVGVDVPRATVMVVEHAERFGLSQLHQLRGRVGRGSQRSYCVLMVGADEPGGQAMERLSVMEATHDGFRIAERDLELRGPGMVLGTQQHGLSDLQFLAQILRSPDLLAAARDESRLLVEEDSSSRARAVALLRQLRPSWRRRLDLAGIG
jgi:ATP-dependent DNA helicase RecG